MGLGLGRRGGSSVMTMMRIHEGTREGSPHGPQVGSNRLFDEGSGMPWRARSIAAVISVVTAPTMMTFAWLNVMGCSPVGPSREAKFGGQPPEFPSVVASAAGPRESCSRRGD
jgi:hypothetical protein